MALFVGPSVDICNEKREVLLFVALSSQVTIGESALFLIPNYKGRHTVKITLNNHCENGADTVVELKRGIRDIEGLVYSLVEGREKHSSEQILFKGCRGLSLKVCVVSESHSTGVGLEND